MALADLHESGSLWLNMEYAEAYSARLLFGAAGRIHSRVIAAQLYILASSDQTADYDHSSHSSGDLAAAGSNLVRNCR